ncbi:phosphoglycolate phosphatase [Pelagibius litoralis]|uniref:Phosphoglycolate phosphatase n=1 Tax=Pelagibius litoralis TaxID=374515 RepID=A0A967F3N6_9PROT|nr:phosphoglycolate phosphatase [Pelagibius litoralis]NIA72437.1 phosphoglycolate phosphatase [Pelagibius litoralis]
MSVDRAVQRPVKAVIFDLDGTLVHSAPDIHAAAVRLLGERGHQGPDLATVTGFVGNGVPALVERLLAWAKEAVDPSALKAAIGRFHQIYNEAPSALSELYDGVSGTLETLSAAGLRLGVCTNKPLVPARQLLADLGIDGYIEVLVGGDSLPQRKPDPRPLLHAAEGLGVAPEAIVFVGDSEVDAATAQAAGVLFALFAEGYRKSPLAMIPHQTSFSQYGQLHSRVVELAGAEGLK